MMGLRLADGIDRALFAVGRRCRSGRGAGRGEARAAGRGGLPRDRPGASQGDRRRPPAPERAAGASHRMRLLVFVLGDAGVGDRAWAQPHQAKPAPQGQPAAGQARAAQVAVHAARLQDHDRDRGRLSAVQLPRPQGPAGRLRDGAGAGGLPAHEGRVRVRRRQMGRSGAGPARQEVRHRHVLARGQQRAAASGSACRAATISRPAPSSPPRAQPFDGPPALLRNKRIGVQKDSTHADWLDKSFRRSAQIKRYPTVNDALAGAGQGRDRRGVRRQGAALAVVAEARGQCCEIMGQDIKDTQTLGVGVSAGIRREDIKLREAFNKAFERADRRRDLQEDQRQVLSVPAQLTPGARRSRAGAAGKS